MAEGYELNPSIGRHSLGIVKGTNTFDDYLASGFAEKDGNGIPSAYIYFPNLEFVTTVNITSFSNAIIYIGSDRWITQTVTDIESISITNTRIRLKITLPNTYSGLITEPITVRMSITIEAS